MASKIELENDLKLAMKSGDGLRKSVIRMALSAVKLAEIDKGASLDEAGVISILQKEVKSRRESIADAEKASRSDLIAEAQAEIGVLEGYLPKAFTFQEREEMARQAIQETGATSLREIGLVMKVLVPRLQGKATGDQASQMVRKLLA